MHNLGALLLTRLREESHASALTLRRRGWSVFRAPLLSLEALPAYELAEKLEKKPTLLVTSKSALRMLARTRDCSPSHNSATRALSLLAVGEESAALAKRLGFASVRAAQGTLVSLIEEIRQHHPQSTPVLHLCGRHRRGNLVESLRKMGYSAERIVLYEAVSVQKLPSSAYRLLNASIKFSSKPPSQPPLYASMFYSPRTADIFARLYAQAFGEPAMRAVRLRFFCLAPSIGVRLRQSFPCARIVCATMPSETSLLQALDEALP